MAGKDTVGFGGSHVGTSHVDLGGWGRVDFSPAIAGVLELGQYISGNTPEAYKKDATPVASVGFAIGSLGVSASAKSAYPGRTGPDAVLEAEISGSISGVSASVNGSPIDRGEIGDVERIGYVDANLSFEVPAELSLGFAGYAIGAGVSLKFDEGVLSVSGFVDLGIIGLSFKGELIDTTGVSLLSTAEQLARSQALKQAKQQIFDNIERAANNPGAYDLDGEIQDALDYLESLRHPYEPEDPVGSVSGGIRDANGVPIMDSIQTPSGTVSVWRGSHYTPGQPNDDGLISGGVATGDGPGFDNTGAPVRPGTGPQNSDHGGTGNSGGQTGSGLGNSTTGAGPCFDNNSTPTSGTGPQHAPPSNPAPPGPGEISDSKQIGAQPIVLDLNGNGVQIADLSKSTQFIDAGGDGLQHRSAWAAAGDGVLFVDADGDGKISDRREYVFTDWAPGAGDDMEALRAAFDSNGDGKLTAADARFGEFKVMVTNADGSTTVKTLGTAPDQLNITEINLRPDATRIVLPDGSAITGQSTFVMGGVTRTAANVTLVAEAQGFRVVEAVGLARAA